ncbi:MAG: pseudouridine synthase [Pseudomonadota bacterium]|jgi:23S rRNA pseudouridine2457 synthase|nr:pseudouridine synthase [Pseudomonadota bacterium]
MSRILLFNKPFRVLTQFTDAKGRTTLADFIPISGVYPAGRLDFDSEGLLILTDDGRLQQHLTNPTFKLPKSYCVQLEGEIDDTALTRLRRGVQLKDGPTRPARVRRIAPPHWLWPRDPPVRLRLRQPTCWIELVITEGRNRQVRRMTAEVGFPTLRLIRCAIGDWTLTGLAPGQWRQEQVHLPATPTRSPSRRRSASPLRSR